MEGSLYLVGAIGALLLVTLSQQAAAARRRRTRPRARCCWHCGTTPASPASWPSTSAGRCTTRSSSGPGFSPGGCPAGESPATTLGLTAALLVLFGVMAPLSTLQVALNLPFFVNEMVLAGWLIVKGFAAQPVAADQAGTSAPLPVLQMTSTS